MVSENNYCGMRRFARGYWLDRFANTKSICTLLFVLCFVSIAYFNNGALWNQNARLDPIFSFVEPGSADYHSFRINRFIVFDGKNMPTENTGDWAWYEGNFYSNKAPGTILLGTAVYLVLYNTEKLIGIAVHNPRVEIVNAWLINLAVSGIPVALAMALFYLLLLHFRMSHPMSMLVTISMFLGTALFPYSTQLWGHTTTAAFMVFALYVYLRQAQHYIFWTGMLAGFAVCMDYQAFIFTAAMGVLILIRERQNVLYYIAGGLLPMIVFAGYHYICFGHPLAFASSYSNPIFIDTDRTLGMFGVLSFTALWKLLFSIERGIFIQMPVLCFSLLGFYYWFREDPKDNLLWLILATCVFYLLLIASFNGWHGGATAVSRYLIPLLSLLGLTLKAIPWHKWHIRVFIALSAISISNMLAISAVSPLVEEGNPNPVLANYIRWLSGELEPFLLTIRLHKFRPDLASFEDFNTWNLGELIGIKGAWSILPLVVIQASILALLFGLAFKQLKKLPETSV